MKELVFISLILATVAVAQRPARSFLSAISFEPHGTFSGVSDTGRDDRRPVYHGYEPRIQHGPLNQFNPQIVDQRHGPERHPYRHEALEHVPVHQGDFLAERRRIPSQQLGRSPGQPSYRSQIQRTPSRHQGFLPTGHDNGDLSNHQKESSTGSDFDSLLSPLPNVGELGPSFGKQENHPVNVNHDVRQPSRNQIYQPAYSHPQPSEIPPARYSQQEDKNPPGRYPHHGQDQSLRPSIPFPTDNQSSKPNPPLPSIPDFGVPLQPPSPIQPVHHRQHPEFHRNSNFPHRHPGYSEAPPNRFQPSQQNIQPVHDFSHRHVPQSDYPNNNFSERPTAQGIHPIRPHNDFSGRQSLHGIHTDNDFSRRPVSHAAHPNDGFSIRPVPHGIHPNNDGYGRPVSHGIHPNNDVYGRPVPHNIHPNNDGYGRQAPQAIHPVLPGHTQQITHPSHDFPQRSGQHNIPYNNDVSGGQAPHEPHSFHEFFQLPSANDKFGSHRQHPRLIPDQQHPQQVNEPQVNDQPHSETEYQQEYFPPRSQTHLQRQHEPSELDLGANDLNTAHRPVSDQQPVGLPQGHLLNPKVTDHVQPPFVPAEHQPIHHEPSDFAKEGPENGNEVQYNVHPEEPDTQAGQYSRPLELDQPYRDHDQPNEEINKPSQTENHAVNPEGAEALVYAKTDNDRSHPSTLVSPENVVNTIPAASIPTKVDHVQFVPAKEYPTSNSLHEIIPHERSQDKVGVNHVTSNLVGNPKKGTVADHHPRTASVVQGPGVVIVKPNSGAPTKRDQPLTREEVTRQLAPSSELIPPGLQYKDLSTGYSLTDEAFGYPDKAISGELKAKSFLAPILGYKNFVEARPQFDVFSLGPFSGSSPNINDYLSLENVYPTGYKEGDFKMATPRDRSCRAGSRTLRMFSLLGGKCWVVNPDYQRIMYSQCSAPGGSCSTCSEGSGSSGRCSEDYSWVTVWAYCQKSDPGQKIRHVRIYLSTGCSCKTYYC